MYMRPKGQHGSTGRRAPLPIAELKQAEAEWQAVYGRCRGIVIAGNAKTIEGSLH